MSEIARHTTGLMVGILIAGVLPLSFVAATPAVHERTWLWALALSVFAGCQYSRLIWLGQRRLYELSFWLFVYVFLGLAPMVQLRAGVAPSTTPDIMPEYNGQAFLIVWIGVVAFTISARMKQPAVTVVESGPEMLNERRAMLMVVGCLVASGYYAMTIGPLNLFSARDDLDQLRAGFWPDPTTRVLVTTAGSISLLVALNALLHVRRQRISRGQRSPRIVLACTAAALLITVNPVSNPRILFGTAALGLAAMAGAFATPGRFRISAVALLVVLLLVFPYADRFRSSIDSSQPLLTKGSLENTLVTGDYDAFSQINNTAYYVQVEGLSYGRQAAGVALFWVPRAFWSSKPFDTGVVLGQFRRYSFTNLSAPLWSELYINGGWLLVAAGMAGLGRIIRRADDQQQARKHLGLLGCILPFYLIIVLRGSLLAATATLVIFIALAMFARSGRPAATSPVPQAVLLPADDGSPGPEAGKSSPREHRRAGADGKLHPTGTCAWCHTRAETMVPLDVAIESDQSNRARV